MTRAVVFTMSICLVALAFFINGWGAELAADVVFYNGKILTAASEDPHNFPIAKEIAVYGGKILAVGDDDEILKLAGTRTQRINLKGKTVIPGLIDTHLHIHSSALGTFGKHLQEAPYFWFPTVTWETKEKGLAEVAALVKKHKPGEWVLVKIGGEDDIPVVYNVTRFDLDTVSPDNPVYIDAGAQQNHQIVNSKALEKLLKRYPNGLGGMVKDDKGRATGFLKAVAAGAMFHEMLPKPPAEALAPVYKKEMERILAGGTTTVSTRLPGYSIAAYNLLATR